MGEYMRIWEIKSIQRECEAFPQGMQKRIFVSRVWGVWGGAHRNPQERNLESQDLFGKNFPFSEVLEEGAGGLSPLYFTVKY